MGCKHGSAPEALWREAQSAFEHGDLVNAAAKAEQGFTESQGTDQLWNYKFRTLRAQVYLWQGKKDRVLDLLSTDPPAALASSEFAIRRKITLGSALTTARRVSEAQLCLQQARELAAQADIQLIGEVALAQGVLAQTQQQYAPAEELYRETLKIAHESRDAFLEAEALGDLGQLFTKIEHYDQAADWYTAALVVMRSHDFRYLQAGTLLNLGWSYLELGDYVNAIDSFEKIEKLSADSRLNQLVFTNIGRINLNQGNFAAATKNFQQALDIARNLHSEASEAVCLDNLALVALREGKSDDANKYNDEALVIKHRLNDRVEILKSLLTAASIANVKQTFDKANSLLQEVILDQKTPVSLSWEAEDELARLYVATHRTSQARAQFQKVLDTLGNARHSLHDTQSRLAFSTREADFYTDYIRFLVNEKDPVRALQVAERMHARSLEEGLEPTHPKARGEVQLTAIQNSLRRQGQIVLAYWLAPDKSFLWAIAPSQVKLFYLPPRQEIEDKVERYQKNVTGLDDVARGDADGQDLYRILIGPAQALIPPGARVVLIPDGKLGKMNFETLLVPGSPSPHFWIDDAQIEEASSITVLMGFRPSQHPSRKLLVIGNPVQVTSDYPRLAYAPQEINAAAEHFMPAQKSIVSGPDATPSSYASSKPEQFDLIHFATHGFASEASPLDSAIILSPQADNSFKLYARDIMKTRLKADLVTISACYGAGKRIYGEGLVGLAWAFLKAGAHQVIAGLWNVEDPSTPVLMETFYAELADGKSAAKALRDAKLKMLHSKAVSRLPYYWGVLQLYTGS